MTAVHMGFTTLKKEAVLVCKCFAPKHRLISLFVYLFIPKILVWLILDCLTNFPDRGFVDSFVHHSFDKGDDW